MTMKTETIETISSASSKFTAAGLGTIGLGWLTAELALGIIGALATLAGLLVNSHYKRKANKRRHEEHALRHLALQQHMAQRAEMFELRKELMKKGIPVGPPSDFVPLFPADGPAARGGKEEDDGT